MKQFLSLVRCKLSLIRWKYFAPRIIVACLIMLIAYLFTDTLLKQTVVSAGQRLTGAQVDVGELRSSLLGMKVRLNNVAVANPDNPMKNLWQFEHADLKFNAKAAFQRKLVVEKGTIHGLTFDQPRDEAARKIEGITDTWHQQLPSLFQKSWIGWFRDQLTNRIKEELETPQLAQQLAKQWPQRYDALEQKLKGIRFRFEAIKKSVQKPRPGNPLEVVRVYQQSIQKLNQINTDFQNLRKDIGQLPAQVRSDWQRIGTARVNDQAKITKMFRWQKPTPAKVVDRMFGPQTKYWMAQTLYWTTTAQKWMNAGKSLIHGDRGKGIDIELVSRPRHPSFLIRHLEVSGQGELSDGSLVSFTGDLDGLTTQPDVYRRPTRLRATLEHNNQNWSAKLIVDPSQTEDNLLVRVECKDLIIPARTLGEGDWLSVRLLPGRANVKLHLSIVGGRLAGELRFEQANLGVEAEVAGKQSVGGAQLASLINDSFDRVDRLLASMTIGGTVNDPKLSLKSDFAERIAAAVDVAMQDRFKAFGIQAAREATKVMDRELLKLERTLQQRRVALAQNLQLDQRNVQDMIRNLSRRVTNGVIPPNFSRRLPFKLR